MGGNAPELRVLPRQEDLGCGYLARANVYLRLKKQLKLGPLEGIAQRRLARCDRYSLTLALVQVCLRAAVHGGDVERALSITQKRRRLHPMERVQADADARRQSNLMSAKRTRVFGCVQKA
jgi:hypothetical protein